MKINMSAPVVIFAAIVFILAILLITIFCINKCIKFKKNKTRYELNREARRERERIILELFPDISNNNAINIPSNDPNGEIEYLYDMDDYNK